MRSRSGFTLVELLVVITIIAILSSLMLIAMFGAQESARAQKTRSIIAKLEAVIMPMYEDYRARAVPINTLNLSGRAVAKARLDTLRELQRLKMPDRWTQGASAKGLAFSTSFQSRIFTFARSSGSSISYLGTPACCGLSSLKSFSITNAVTVTILEAS